MSREETYNAAMNAAIEELDEVFPVLQQFMDRVIALKQVVMGTGKVLGVYDDVDDKYKFSRIPISREPRRQLRPQPQHQSRQQHGRS